MGFSWQLPGPRAVLCQLCFPFYHFYFIVLLVFTLLKVSFYVNYFHNKSPTVIKILRQFLHELLSGHSLTFLAFQRLHLNPENIFWDLASSFILLCDRRIQVKKKRRQKTFKKKDLIPNSVEFR